MENNLGYPVLVILALCAIATYSWLNKRRRSKRLLKEIDAQWGKVPEQKHKASACSNYFNMLRAINKDKFYIDDITWNDLEMDKVFGKINATWSVPGEECLYAMLREPVFNDSVLKQRDRLIRLFSENRDLRRSLQFHLACLGKVDSVNIPDYFLGGAKDSPLLKNRYMLMAAAPLAALAVMLINAPLGFLLLFISIFSNMSTAYRARTEISSHLVALSYIVAMIKSAEKIARLLGKADGETAPELAEKAAVLKNTLGKVKGLIRKSSLLLYRTEDVFIEYVKTFFLGEILAFRGMFRKMSKYGEELHAIFKTLGELDSLIAVASYRANLESWCNPELDHLDPTKGIKLEFEDIVHPLLDDPVPNSLSTKKSVLITGSNASGKSTFLKTTAVNAILAQTIFTCLAKKYVSRYFMIFTSMALRDSLHSGESYYIVEIRSLKRIIDSINDKVPVLCFIDEVLRGTNTVERIAASSQALHYLSESNCLCFAATHDLELTSILHFHFDNYHFQERIENNEIIFDYKLYPGRSQSRNAIRLLKLIGYRDSIVEQAERRAEAFLETGSWQAIED